MKPVISMLALAGIVVFIFTRCSSNHKRERTSTETKAEVEKSNNSSLPVSSAAAVATTSDTSLHFIRTADIKFQVNDVAQATYAIEDAVSEQGGYVAYTNLQSRIDDKNTIPVSADSTLVVTHYQVTNTITLRVPNNRLDTTLKKIAGQVSYLDYRVIRADDVALQLLGNKLKQQRLAKHEQRLTAAIDNRGRKLEQVTEAENDLLNKQEQADDAVISNLSTANQIKYSTITLDIYQPAGTTHHLIANEKNIHTYQPGLGLRLKEAAQTGWEAMTDVLVAIVQLWWLIVLAILALILYKKVKPLLYNN